MKTISLCANVVFQRNKFSPGYTLLLHITSIFRHHTEFSSANVQHILALNQFLPGMHTFFGMSKQNYLNRHQLMHALKNIIYVILLVALPGWLFDIGILKSILPQLVANPTLFLKFLPLRTAITTMLC